MGHQSSRHRWGAISDSIRSKGSYRKATRICKVKRELWGVVSAIKSDRDYLIGAEAVIETDCLPILGMMRCCMLPDVAMLRWIAYIKSINPDVRHISGNDNAIADMLSRARFRDDIAESDNKEVSEDYFASEHICRVNVIQEFREEEYEGESLMIGKVLQEIEDSSDDKEKRSEIQVRSGKSESSS